MSHVASFAGIIVRTAKGAQPAVSAAAKQRRGRELEPLLPNAAARQRSRGLGMESASGEWLVARAEVDRGVNPWTQVHEFLDGLRVDGGIAYAEPDLEQRFPVSPRQAETFGVRSSAGAYDPQNPAFPRGPGFAWHLGEEFSQLGSARAGKGTPPRIMHIDTGYDPAHSSAPRHILGKLARDFSSGREMPGAVDPGSTGFPGVHGHGTGTLGILAGGRAQRREEGNFDGDIGAAPEAHVIPVRIAESVVLFRTSALARALDYALAPYDGPSLRDPGDFAPPVDVVSLSMGGLASNAWAEAVNAAYEAGIVIVAAAGNNFSVGFFGLPTRFIVYPARFRRVIAACGVMADRRPYFGLPAGQMQGCWGPESKMKTALAAFTPNMPWAERGAPAIVDMDGAGTSSATPQIAGAAALYIAKYRHELDRYREGWQRVEAVRHALFATADKTADGGSSSKLGNGILQARAALAVVPAATQVITPRDSASLAVLELFLGLKASAGSAADESMLRLEAAQLIQRPPTVGMPNPFEEFVDDPDVPASQIPCTKVERFLDAMREHPEASKKLRTSLAATLKEVRRVRVAVPGGPAAPPPPPTTTRPGGQPPGRAAPPRSAAPPLAATAPTRQSFPRPPVRRLTGYAFDPSIAQRLGTRDIGMMTFRLPWETLEPGPVGEYLEVVDHDPTSGCFYAPVDLDDPHLLARDGLAPSEKTPQFHQQMVYAVARLTIAHFEAALGRKALWAPGVAREGARPDDDSRFVPRLRIYPHALRDANAYYSPSRKALLFGYFRASRDDPGEHLPGAMVFTCLSHDIVAHETAHALLDGMHRKFIAPSNPDVLAFHEAFADIVALLQHFTFPEIVRDQIARTRGGLRSQESLLGVLATEFGRATGARGALRSYIGHRDETTGEWRPHVPRPGDYAETLEPHARGGILVAAVFDAFLSIYERRTEDLVRLATGGSGVLPPGNLQPDLVSRLASEASKSAEHVLRMCIRALDYCPPVDITFGEYLRALITADVDLVPDDDLGYRLAFIESFRRRAIYPDDVSALSEESLVWHLADVDRYRPSSRLLEVFAALREPARRQLDETCREQLFCQSRALRRELHDRLQGVLQGLTGATDAECLGLVLPERPGEAAHFEVHAARVANRVGPDGQLIIQCIVELLQRERLAPDLPEADVFEGGSTVVVELGAEGTTGVSVRYVVRKRLAAKKRRSAQVEYRETRGQGTLRGTYFGSCPAMRDAEPFSFLHRA